MSNQAVEHIHKDPEGNKLGMWLFIFSELLFFGGLFISYAIFRSKHSMAFELASQELDVTIGTVNTAILLVSSATIAMSVTAVQRKKQTQALVFLLTTLVLALVFLVNKYFEWGAKFSHGLYPGSQTLNDLGQGDLLFFGLYFAMTGLHALHIIIGVVFIGIMLHKLAIRKINHDDFSGLENTGLYWHLVDLIWIFLFPLFYLIA